MAPFDIKDHLSHEARRRGPGSLPDIVQRFSGVEGVIGMHAGLPPTDAFPLTSISLTHKNPLQPDGTTADPTTTTIDDPTTLTTFQQYNLDFRGYAPLREWLRDLIIRMHSPVQAGDLEVLVATGALSSLEAVFRTLLNPGDPVLVEEFTFSQVLEGLIVPFGYQPLGVAMDAHGMLPESLQERVQAAAAAGKPVRVLYTIPNGQNPTGASLTMARKRAIYAICSANNVAIVEDDPYIYLQYPAHSDAVPGLEVEPGFLSLDTDGRVIRIDTFSKNLAPGLRLGWISTRAGNIADIKAAIISASMGPAGPSQLIAYSILSSWGLPGFHLHLQALQRRYMHSSRVLDAALRAECGSLATWQVPAGGMFLWVRLHGCEDVHEDLMEALVCAKVVIIPGRVFHVRGSDKSFKCAFARLAFSAANDDGLREGARRLGLVLRANQKSLAGAMVANTVEC